MFRRSNLNSEEINEKNKLIEQVVTDYYLYMDYMTKTLTELESAAFAPTKIGNEFEVNPKVIGKISSKDKQSVLVNTMKRFKKAYMDIDMLDSYYTNLMAKRKALIESIDNLQHFYIYTKTETKQKNKIMQLKKSIVKVPFEAKEPLRNLKGAKNRIDAFTDHDTEDFNQVEYLLKKDNDGQYILNNDGNYEINKEYFTTRFYKTKGNIESIIKEQRKKFTKINRAHKNKKQLSNYLKFH
ncbi:hypothetical protein [Staphylococcus equorum]|uniref:hypothetical protein n=1 Tax=Staphylococcus equorum TaxID=246432 RepID=UPI0018692522|nr:hypothetical protein [Staphylococcus equorum]